MANKSASISPYAQSYNSFSGVDIKGVFGNKVIAELQAISYSITREKAPIYTMGSADPRSFSRGKRGIAGTLIFIMFDRHVLLSTLGGYSPDKGLRFQSDIDDIRPGFVGKDGDFSNSSLAAESSSDRTAASTVQNQESQLTTVGSDQTVASAWYVDQIPPFDVTLAAANEYGGLAVMRIFGVEILNEGYGVSIDDIVSEQQHTYVARGILGWMAVDNSANSSQIWTQGGVSAGV
jgi:hypothetical protein